MMLLAPLALLHAAEEASAARPANGQPDREFPMNSQNSLFKFQKGIEPRWFTAENPQGLKGAATLGNDGRKRKAAGSLPSGKSLILAEAEGRPGVVRRIWITFPLKNLKARLRGVRVDFYWDGAKEPAVSAPLGDFFCQGLGKLYPFENALFENAEGRNLLCRVPMPFKNAMKLVVTNESGEDIDPFFYEVDCTFGDKFDQDSLYFHSCWRRVNSSEPKTDTGDFEFLPEIQGRGRFVGVNFSLIADTQSYHTSWWGEGEVKIYLDGDKSHPTLCGTGTEDYIGSSWGLGKFSFPFSGCPYADGAKMEYGFYRLHLPDPIYFSSGMRAVMQQMGGSGAQQPDMIQWFKEKGMPLKSGAHTVNLDTSWFLFDRHDDWAACTYFYLDKPVNGLPPLAPASERMR